MVNYFARNYQLILLVLLYVVVGVYAKPLLFALMPLSVFFLKSRDEMARTFSEVPASVTNTQLVAEM